MGIEDLCDRASNLTVRQRLHVLFDDAVLRQGRDDALPDALRRFAFFGPNGEQDGPSRPPCRRPTRACVLTSV